MMAKSSKRLVNEFFHDPPTSGQLSSVFYKLYITAFASRLYADKDYLIDFYDAYQLFIRELNGIYDHDFVTACFLALWPEPNSLCCHTYDMADKIFSLCSEEDA